MVLYIMVWIILKGDIIMPGLQIIERLIRKDLLKSKSKTIQKKQKRVAQTKKQK